VNVDRGGHTALRVANALSLVKGKSKPLLRQVGNGIIASFVGLRFRKWDDWLKITCLIGEGDMGLPCESVLVSPGAPRAAPHSCWLHSSLLM
jgi:hypothetical protein